MVRDLGLLAKADAADINPAPGLKEVVLFMGTDGLLYTKTSAGVVLAANNGPKVYAALLSQASTAAPVATILGTNSVGTIVWTRTSGGLYVGTLAGAFTDSRTFLSIGPNIVSDGVELTSYGLVRTSADAVTLTSGQIDADGKMQVADDLMSGISIKIEVYPA